MSTAHPDNISAYQVIGATLRPDADALPMRLRPVLRTRAAPHLYALLDADGGDDVLVAEDESFIDDMIAAGRFMELRRPILAQPDHWLVQMTPRAEPEYLPKVRACERLQEEGRAALVRSSQALADGRLELALEHAAYAAIAMPEDPFPRLAVIALLRAFGADEDQIWMESLPLVQSERGVIAERFREATLVRGIELLVQAIRRDPSSDEYGLKPAWLPPMPSHRGGSRIKPSGWWSQSLKAVA